MFRAFRMKMFLSGYVMAGSLLGLAAFGFAQESPKAQTDGERAKVSDAELRAFVKAYVDNQKIRQHYEPPLMDNKDPNKSQQLQDQANAELKKSLAKQNLTIETDNRIYTEINNDDELRNKALKLVEEERKRSS
jgi:Domain of unknown function (DUF4168)